MKKFISLIITLTIVLSVFMLPTAVNAAGVVKKTMTQYTDLNLTFKKDKNKNYDCTVKNNDDNYIKVKYGNEGKYYWLMVYSLNPTESVKPKITVTDSKSGSVVKSFEITVNPVEPVEMKDIKLNVNTSKIITISNPYNKSSTLKYDKEILSVSQYVFAEGIEEHRFSGLKEGTTTVTASIKGNVIGTFKVTVGDFKASVKKSYSEKTIKYNKHIKSYNLYSGGSIDIGKAINYFHMDAVYTVKIANKEIAASKTIKKDEDLPKRVMLYSLKTGKTAVEVYEKRGDAEKQLIGTINLTVKKAKDSEVYKANRADDNDGLFYEFFISPGEKADLKSMIVRRYVNGCYNTVKFKKSEYTVKIKAGPSDALSVNKNGVITCLGFGKERGSNWVKYKVTFKDGSKASGSGSLCIVDEDFY